MENKKSYRKALLIAVTLLLLLVAGGALLICSRNRDSIQSTLSRPKNDALAKPSWETLAEAIASNVDISQLSEEKKEKLKKHLAEIFQSQGNLDSKLSAINSCLEAFSIQPIDAKMLRKVYSIASVKEIMNMLKKMVEDLNGDHEKFDVNLERLEELMVEYWVEFSDNDTLAIKKHHLGNEKPSPVLIKYYVGLYYKDLLTAAITNIKTSIRTADIPDFQKKTEFALWLSDRLPSCKVLTSVPAFVNEIIDDARQRFYCPENDDPFTASTNLATNTYFNDFVAVCKRLIGGRKHSDLSTLRELCKKDIMNPLKTQAHNLYLDHYFKRQVEEWEHDANEPSTISLNSLKCKEFKSNIYREVAGIVNASVPLKARALKMLETYNVVGKAGNGLLMYWSDLPVNDSNEDAAIFDKIKAGNRADMDKLIADALEKIKRELVSSNGDLKDVFESNYYVLKSFHSDPTTIPDLSK